MRWNCFLIKSDQSNAERFHFWIFSDSELSAAEHDWCSSFHFARNIRFFAMKTKSQSFNPVIGTSCLASSRILLLHRFLTTAFPTFFDAVNPILAQSSEFLRHWITKKSVRKKNFDDEAKTKSLLFRITEILFNLYYADNLARPFALRAFKTCPPAWVLALNPCLRFLTSLLGL